MGCLGIQVSAANSAERDGGIDVGAKESIYRQMEEWTRAGWGILWSSSELQELLGISDRVYVLANGRVTAHFADRPFAEHEIMAHAATS